MKRFKRPTRIKRSSEVTTNNGRITNDTVAEHREEVLGKARKFIYPLRQSKHKLVLISVSLFLAAVVVFFTYCGLALYKFKTNSNFIYRVTQVIPFPIARVGTDFVAYENYLFEVNRYTHYYSTQQQLDFGTDAGKQQLAEFKKRALQKVIDDAYIQDLADKNNVTITDKQVNDQIAIVRSQNRLGANDQEFRSVLKDQFNWDQADFKRSLKDQLLSQAVVSKLDTQTHDKAKDALAKLKAGTDFASLATQVSEDQPSKSAGGDFGFPIEKDNRDINPTTVNALFKLKDGEHSGIIDVGYGLEIVKRIKTMPDSKVNAAHIIFNFKDIQDYINPIKDKKKARAYLRL